MMDGSDSSMDYTYFVVEQFVSEVMDFSSQYGSDASISYTAHNIVGKPTKFPSYGDFSQTFVMRDYGPWWRQCPSGAVFRTPLPCPRANQVRGSNFIDVKFDLAVYPFRIHVYETYNPGGLASIWAGDCRGGWKLLWSKCQSSMSPIVNQPRQFSPPIQATDFSTKLLRLEFDADNLSYYTEIDAVCLLGTLDPISPGGRAAAMLPQTLSPLMTNIVSRKLHVLPRPRQCVAACADQLNPSALERFVREQERRMWCPERNNGHFDMLPREVILKIFSFLDTVSLVQVSATCTLLREVSRDPWLYSCADLRQVFHCATNDTLSWLGGLAEKISRVDLSWCGNYGSISPAHLSTFLSTVSPTLTHLNLDNCHIATGQVLSVMANQCSKLTLLSLANCHLLKPQDFQSLSQMASLVSLNLYRTSIQQSSVISLLYNNRSLENLSLAACNNINGDEVCHILSHCQPQLRSLDLWRCSSLSGRGVAALAQGCPHLEDLDLGWCLNVQASSGAILSLTESCPHIKRLFLTAHRQTGDRELMAISKLSQLQQLDILGNRNISFAAVRDLIARLSDSLRLLDISFCDQLGEANIADIIQHYPHLNVKWSFTDSI